MSKLDSFTGAYIEAMLWSTYDESDEQGGEPFDKNYGPGDIAPETMELIEADCADFQERFGHLVEDDDSPEIDRWGRWELAGHDFWLTREGHGAGFWDGGWPKHGDELTKAAKSYGSFDLGLGDDGLIYGPGADWYRKHHPHAARGARPSRHRATKAPARAMYIDRRRLGEMMAPWGGDGDLGIGAVGSYYSVGQVYPDRRFVEGAISQAEGYIPLAERGEHGWTQKDARDLRTIASGLRYYLEKDYPESASTGAHEGEAFPHRHQYPSPVRPPHHHVAPRFAAAGQPRFRDVKDMLLNGLRQHGWTVASGLKIPHATSPDGQIRLWFKAQAIYMNDLGTDPRRFENTHSVSSDMREFKSAEDLIRTVEQWRSHRPHPMSEAGYAVADFSTLAEIIEHAMHQDGATHVLAAGRNTKLYFPRGGGEYEEACVWHESGYWHSQAPSDRTVVQGLPHGAELIETYLSRSGRGRHAAEEAFGRRTRWSDWEILDSIDKGNALPPEAEHRALKLAQLGFVDTTGTWRLTAKGRHVVDHQVPVAAEEARIRGHRRPRRHAVRDYVAVDTRGRTIAGPFKDYSQAKSAADAQGGYVQFSSQFPPRPHEGELVGEVVPTPPPAPAPHMLPPGPVPPGPSARRPPPRDPSARRRSRRPQ